MNINDQAERKFLDDRILVECYHASRKGISVSALILKCSAAGFEGLTGADIDKRIRYLESGNMLREVEKKLHPEGRSYVTTKDGEDYLANEGLA